MVRLRRAWRWSIENEDLIWWTIILLVCVLVFGVLGIASSWGTK